MPLPKIPAGSVRLENLSVPGCLVGSTDPMTTVALTLGGETIGQGSAETVLDMKGAMALPALIDMHTHLDKSHIWPRTPNPDGTFMGALEAVQGDSTTRWAAEDVRARMEFSLKCAWAHGTRAIRTHLDSHAPQDGISWPVFAEVRQDWADRIALQAACLVSCDYAPTPEFRRTADIVAGLDGVLGMVTYPNDDLPIQLQAFFSLAEARGLDVDFHVDETLDPASNTLRNIAQTVIDRGFERPVTVGHLCSLSTMPEAEALSTLDLVARAGLHVVSLPMCNLYLQDRHGGRTPRNRGITLVHEMAERGISVSFASDNNRDPFYAYGDMDMIEVWREATRIGHLDHSAHDWPRSFVTNPAAACGFAPPSLEPGAPADLVICNARSWSEFLSRPQADRIVIRKGRVIDRTLPDYSELDSLMRTA